MATITGTAPTQPVRHPLRAAGTNEAIGWLEQVLTSAVGTISGEDAQAALDRKIEPSNLIGFGLQTPVASDTSPWIFFRNDNPKHFFLKEQDGSTYSWLGPFFQGDYQTRIIYSASTTEPNNPAITWNYENQTFNIDNSGGSDWAVDTPNPNWFRIVSLPSDSNTEKTTPNIRIGNPTATDIPYSPSGTGNIPSSVNNVDEALDAFDSATLGGGGSLTQQPSDWAATSGPTRILNKPPVPQVEETINATYNPGPTLSGIGSYATFNFNIDQDLRDFSDTYGENLFVEANAKVTIQAGGSGAGIYQFDVRNGVGQTFAPPATASKGLRYLMMRYRLIFELLVISCLLYTSPSPRD